jgi:predicted DNA-binding protein (MmcQ/YjbR family)
MKKDIPFIPVSGISVAIVKNEFEQWQVYLINQNDQKLENVMIRSRGFGELNGTQQQTSVLRHVFPEIAAQHAEMIELIDTQVFHLNNEYWISYFIGNQIYDKKFLFVPDSIIEEHLTNIPLLNKPGILHT